MYPRVERYFLFLSLTSSTTHVRLLEMEHKHKYRLSEKLNQVQVAIRVRGASLYQYLPTQTKRSCNRLTVYAARSGNSS